MCHSFIHWFIQRKKNKTLVFHCCFGYKRKIPNRFELKLRDNRWFVCVFVYNILYFTQKIVEIELIFQMKMKFITIMWFFEWLNGRKKLKEKQFKKNRKKEFFFNRIGYFFHCLFIVLDRIFCQNSRQWCQFYACIFIIMAILVCSSR